MNIRQLEVFLVLIFPRFVALTIRPMPAPVISLLLSAEWRGRKRGTNCSWITLEPANVRVHHYCHLPLPKEFGVNLNKIYNTYVFIYIYMGSLVAQLIKTPPAMLGRPWFDSWVGKIPWRRDQLPTPIFLGFPGGSDDKEAACNA